MKEEEVFIPDEWRGSFKSTDYDYKEEKKTFQEKAMVEIAAWLSETTGTKNIAYAGGCALNCVANSKVLEQGYDLFTPPAPHNGGTSVGCAIYGDMKCYH